MSVTTVICEMRHIRSENPADNMELERAVMAQLIVVRWRDIPAQVIVKAGRKTARRQLSERFEKAIDMCAMRVGAKDEDAYLAEWRRGDPVEVDGEIEDAAEHAAAELEAAFDEQKLKQLIDNAGFDQAQ